ncbi:hypothetical protein [Chryseobacterium sp. CT-SW4]|uniref:hypothetical protein n=1 Tax=Chryseobacterium sp. SW-1 TaxID=3157343 RepID=UPI003B029136
MIKKIIPWLFPTALCLLILNSCSTEDDYLKSNDEQYTFNKFQVFTEQNGITVNYADGFKTLMERYDSLYNVSHTAKAMKTSFSRSETVSGEYIEFNIRSQEFTTDKGEKYVLFPLIRDYQVAGIMVAALKDEETFVEFYEMSSDEKNYSEILSLFTAQYLKSTVNNRLNKYACGFPGYPACDIEGIIITVPKSGGNGNGLPSGGSGGTSGGCSIYENCMDGNLDGGGGGLPELNINPCLKMKSIGKNDTTKSLMSDLKTKTAEDSEYGFVLTKNGNDLNGTPIQGSSNTGEINFDVNAPVSGFIHSHYTGILSIFSASDIFAIAQLYKQGLIADMNSFIMGVVTASDTQYIMVIDDSIKLGAFVANLFEGNTFDPVVLKNYEFVYQMFGIDYDNSVVSNEKGFYNYLEANNTGLKILKGDNNMLNWGLLTKDSNGNIILQNCP